MDSKLGNFENHKYVTYNQDKQCLVLKIPVKNSSSMTLIEMSHASKESSVKNTIEATLSANGYSGRDIAGMMFQWGTPDSKNGSYYSSDERDNVSGYGCVRPYASFSSIGFIAAPRSSKKRDEEGSFLTNIYPYKDGYSICIQNLAKCFVNACKHADQVRGRPHLSDEQYLQLSKPIDWYSVIERCSTGRPNSLYMLDFVYSNINFEGKHYVSLSEAERDLGLFLHIRQADYRKGSVSEAIGRQVKKFRSGKVLKRHWYSKDDYVCKGIAIFCSDRALGFYVKDDKKRNGIRKFDVQIIRTGNSLSVLKGDLRRAFKKAYQFINPKDDEVKYQSAEKKSDRIEWEKHVADYCVNKSLDRFETFNIRARGSKKNTLTRQATGRKKPVSVGPKVFGKTYNSWYEFGALYGINGKYAKKIIEECRPSNKTEFCDEIRKLPKKNRSGILIGIHWFKNAQSIADEFNLDKDSVARRIKCDPGVTIAFMRRWSKRANGNKK